MEMKKFKLEGWSVKNKEGGEVKENLTTLLSALLMNKDYKTMPTGFKQAVMFGRIIKAFENQEELILDDEDYRLLKKIVEDETPAFWGSNPNILKALEEFNNAK